jgi:hypothetical protein
MTSVVWFRTRHGVRSPRPAFRRARWRVLAGVLLSALAIDAGCSHYTPYYRNRAERRAPWVADGDVAHRVLLIGDAGDPDPDGEPVLQALARQVNVIPQRTTVVFLGDNVYERGMPLPVPPSDPVTEAAVEAAVEVAKVVISDVFQTRQEAERIINAQIDVVRGTGARAIFVPGNHDWDQFQPLGGRDRIIAFQDYLDAVRVTEGTDVALLPANACPGPTSIPLGEHGELILLDTQWWIETRDSDKVTPENNPFICPYTTENAVQDALQGMLESATGAKRHAIVAGHHPLATKGAHSGFVDPWTHLFPARIGAAYVPAYVEWMPLPVIGSLVVGIRACCSPSAQDTPNAANKRMRSEVMRPMIAAAKKGAAPLAYAAGHDHDIQVFESVIGPRYLLVSGLGSSGHASPVGSNRRTLFAHSNAETPGFIQIDFLHDGSARLAVIEHESADRPLVEVYSTIMTEQRDGVAAK